MNCISDPEMDSASFPMLFGLSLLEKVPRAIGIALFIQLYASVGLILEL